MTAGRAHASSSVAEHRSRQTQTPPCDRWPAFAPSFFPRVDVPAGITLAELEATIERDFAGKAPDARELSRRITTVLYRSQYALAHDVVRYLYWVHRYWLTLLHLRPCRWADLPLAGLDAHVAVADPSPDGCAAANAVTRAEFPCRFAGEDEQTILDALAGPLAAVTYDPARFTAQLPLAAQITTSPRTQVLRLPAWQSHRPPLPRQEVLALTTPAPQLTALRRHAAVIAREHAGRFGTPRPTPVSDLAPEDYVLLAWPRSDAIAQLLSAEPPNSRPGAPRRRARGRESTARLRYTPTRGITLSGLSVVKGEIRATNDDVVANAAWHWSPMDSADVFERTGIRERRYTARSLDELAADAAVAALENGDLTAPPGAVVACSATNTQLMPSLAARVADYAGLPQLAGVFDVVAACAGLPYGLALSARIAEETDCPVLLVLAEKFSDKIGTVRASRMLFGDGAAALVVSPARDGRGDVELIHTYAGGTTSEVDAVTWPNPAFNSQLTVDGPGARSIVARYLARILADLADATVAAGQAIEKVDLIVPHQANERMIRELAANAGIEQERLYFNVEHVGNLGGASIPVALHDAIADATITTPTRVLAPAFAAGALAGFVVLTVTPELTASRARSPHTGG